MIEQIILRFSYFVIFIFLFANGITGIPSSQLIYIIVGWLIYKDKLSFWVSIVTSIGGHILGNLFLYEFSRKKGQIIYKKLNKFTQQIYNREIFTSKNLKKTRLILQKNSIIYLFIGKLVNPIKLIINIPAGISKLNRNIFYPIIILTSTIWGSIFLSIGYFIGKDLKFGIIYGLVMFFISSIVLLHFKKEYNKLKDNL